MKEVAEIRINEDKQTVTVPVSYFESLAETVARKTAKKIYEELYSAEAERRSFDKRLYNVRLLLKHYRMLKEHAEIKVEELNDITEDDVTAMQILDSFQNMRGTGKEELKLQSVISSTMRTKTLIDYLDNMLGIYRHLCQTSGKQEDERRINVLETIYINPMEMSVVDTVYDLADKWFVSDRQIWRDVTDAIERLTALLFGIDGVNLLEQRKKKLESGAKDGTQTKEEAS